MYFLDTLINSMFHSAASMDTMVDLVVFSILEEVAHCLNISKCNAGTVGCIPHMLSAEVLENFLLPGASVGLLQGLSGGVREPFTDG